MDTTLSNSSDSDQTVQAVRLRNMLIEAGGIMMPGNPIKISGCADPHVMPGAATLDQHGEQIRQEFSS
ncbi:hypothetical protein E3174_25990 [Escherichia coli O157:H7]|nr:hypothetical protein [Escherichia coli O157:H7]QKB08012.1 hypothetical protein E3160_19785 [Escherichia coli O157:H7]RDH53444.1 hypothetical protein C5F56_24990 [Escherichia coli]